MFTTIIRLRRLALGVGVAGTLSEFFIGILTIRSGYAFGGFDLFGTAIGLLALLALWRHPKLAAFLWLLTVPLLYY